MNNIEKIKKFDLTVLLEEENDSQVKKTLKENGAQNLTERPLVKIKLAYPVNKRETAYMGVYIFDMPPESIKEVQKKLNMEQNVLRYLLLNATIKKGSGGQKEQRRDDRKEKMSGEKEKFLSNEALESKIEEFSDNETKEEATESDS